MNTNVLKVTLVLSLSPFLCIILVVLSNMCCVRFANSSHPFITYREILSKSFFSSTEFNQATRQIKFTSFFSMQWGSRVSL